MGPGPGRETLRDGVASVTAQRPAAYGDPGADERLARDVAGTARVERGGRMVRYLAARTTFFDRVVVLALDRGCPQVVIAAAGYDGRALRYAKPGVRWFELDHPATQADKRERLDHIGVGTRHASFVAADFAVDPIASALTGAGHEAGRSTLFLCEGVAVYLERHVLERLLRELRAVAAPASRLAISLSVSTGAAGLAARRGLFRAAVAAMGEPARTTLTADEVGPMFAATGWREVPTAERPAGDRARSVGLVVAEPV